MVIVTNPECTSKSLTIFLFELFFNKSSFLVCFEDDNGFSFPNEEMCKVFCLMSKEESIALTNNCHPIASMLFIKVTLDMRGSFSIRWQCNSFFGYFYSFIEHVRRHFASSNCNFLVRVRFNNHFTIY